MDRSGAAVEIVREVDRHFDQNLFLG